MSRINFDAVAKWADGGTAGDIRITPAGQPSVIDMIRVLGGQKDPSKFWRRLKEAHPEVRTICPDFQFPGPRQRLTPTRK